MIKQEKTWSALFMNCSCKMNIKIYWTHTTIKHVYFHGELKGCIMPFCKNDLIDLKK